MDYSAELMATLKAGEHLEAGGEREMEIRGCSIWAVEVRKEGMELEGMGGKEVVK
jgi:hypothetical protein